MFCVQCGLEVGDALTSSGLCHACFLEKNVFTRIPEHADVEVCTHCRARRRGEQWFEPPEGGHRLDLIADEAARAALDIDKRVTGARVRSTVLPEDERNFSVTLTTTGEAEGVAFSEDATTRVRFKGATCQRCSRMMGGYFEGIVQVRRAGNRDLTPEEIRSARASASRIIDRIVDQGDRNAFVLKDQVIHGGLDVYVSTNTAGRQIAKSISHEFGGRVTEHPKIAGQRDGIEIWRVTFAVRLPEYRAGDVVVVKEEPLLVAAVTPKTVTLRQFGTGHTRVVEPPDLAKATVLQREDSREAVVVSETDGELQVLDPWSFATVSVLKPAGLGAAGDTVQVLRWEDELLPLPPL